jgi:hypothetical protein
MMYTSTISRFVRSAKYTLGGINSENALIVSPVARTAGAAAPLEISVLLLVPSASTDDKLI